MHGPLQGFGISLAGHYRVRTRGLEGTAAPSGYSKYAYAGQRDRLRAVAVASEIQRVGGLIKAEEKSKWATSEIS